MKEKSLLTHIQQRIPLIISTDGAKEHQKSGGRGIIAVENGHHITTGYNSNFGQLKNITSYRSEVYASLTATLFLHHYCQFFCILLHNKFTALCDNQTFINNLTWILGKTIQPKKYSQRNRNRDNLTYLAILTQKLCNRSYIWSSR